MEDQEEGCIIPADPFSDNPLIISLEEQNWYCKFQAPKYCNKTGEPKLTPIAKSVTNVHNLATLSFSQYSNDDWETTFLDMRSILNYKLQSRSLDSIRDVNKALPLALLPHRSQHDTVIKNKTSSASFPCSLSDLNMMNPQKHKCNQSMINLYNELAQLSFTVHIFLQSNANTFTGKAAQSPTKIVHIPENEWFGFI